MHSKSALLDGERAIIGGSNVDNPAENDLAVEIRGSAVIDLYKEAYHAALHALQGVQAPFMTRAGSDSPHTVEPLRRIIEDLKTPERDLDEPRVDIIGKRGIDWRGPYYRQPATRQILRAVTRATKEICLRSPNVNDVVLLSALCIAARRGVEVKILLPHGYQSIRSFIDCAANYAPLIFRAHKVPPAAKPNFQVKWFSEDGKTMCNSHAKRLVVDGTATFGSMNADNQSLCFSRELIVTMTDPKSNETIKREGFDHFWDLGIAAKDSWLVSVLPLPEASWQRRLGRLLRYPLIVVERIKHWAEQRSFE